MFTVLTSLLIWTAPPGILTPRAFQLRRPSHLASYSLLECLLFQMHFSGRLPPKSRCTTDVLTDFRAQCLMDFLPQWPSTQFHIPTEFTLIVCWTGGQGNHPRPHDRDERHGVDRPKNSLVKWGLSDVTTRRLWTFKGILVSGLFDLISTEHPKCKTLGSLHPKQGWQHFT